jgi:large subunit ribosomal protein L25
MKSITITGSKRESVGKVATKALRNADKVPCVLYGGENAIHFSAEEKAFKKLVYTPNVYTATIEIEGEKAVTCILKDIQFHPVNDRILHVDFYQLFDDKEVTMDIPVNLIGTSPGVMIGGSLRFPNRKLRVKALPVNLPDSIDADISKLEIGDKLFISDLEVANCTVLQPANAVVAQVRMSRAAKAPVEGEEGAEAVTEEAAAE